MFDESPQTLKECCSDSAPSIRRKLDQRIVEHTKILDNLKAAKQALDDNPAIADVLETVQKALRY